MDCFLGLFLGNKKSQDAIFATNIFYSTGIAGNDHDKNITASTDISSWRGSLLRWRCLHL